MSKEPQPSGSDPSEIVPKLSKTQQEATELDLWDLDGDEEKSEIEVSSPNPTALPSKKVSKASVRTKKPVERQIEIPLIAGKQDSPEEEDKTASAKKPAATKKRTVKKKVATKKVPSKGEEKHNLGDFDDLDEIEDSPKSEPKVTKSEYVSKEQKSGAAKPEPKEEKEETTDQEDTDNEPTNAPNTNDEETAKPFSIPQFSKIEKISLASLAAILLIAAILSTIHFANRVPTRPTITEKIDFPVEGERLIINSASTYWREPKSGKSADVVRRGTKLIPILEISFQTKKPAAIRVFFRNDEGDVIGDGITRSISGDGKVSIPATAGFEDIGMHAAYRTGDSDPWVVQIYEGPNANASRNQFKKVLETEISTDRR